MTGVDYPVAQPFSLSVAQAQQIVSSASAMQPYTIADTTDSSWFSFPKTADNTKMGRNFTDSFQFNSPTGLTAPVNPDTNGAQSINASQASLAAHQLQWDGSASVVNKSVDNPISPENAAQGNAFAQSLSTDLNAGFNGGKFSVKDVKDMAALDGDSEHFSSADLDMALKQQGGLPNAPIPGTEIPANPNPADGKAFGQSLADSTAGITGLKSVSKAKGGQYNVDQNGTWTVGKGESAEQFTRQYLTAYDKKFGLAPPTQEQIVQGTKNLLAAPSDSSSQKLNYSQGKQLKTGAKYDANVIQNAVLPKPKTATENSYAMANADSSGSPAAL